MKEMGKDITIQANSFTQPLTTISGTTIAGQIIKILEDNQLTIAKSKQILIDVENALNSQRVHSNIQSSELSGFYLPKTRGISPQTIGIVDYTTK